MYKKNILRFFVHVFYLILYISMFFSANLKTESEEDTKILKSLTFNSCRYYTIWIMACTF